MFVHPNVVKVIAADLPRRNVETGNFETGNGRRFFRKQNSLNVARDFEIVIEPLFFIRFGVNDGVVEGEGGLLGDRFEDDKITRREWRAHRAVANREHAHVLFAIKQGRCHQRSGSERCLTQACQFRHVPHIGERNRLRRLPDGADQTFARWNSMHPQKSFQGSGGSRGLVQNVARHRHEWRTTFGKKHRHKLVPAAIGEIERAPISVKNSRGSFHDQPMQVMRLDGFTKSFTQPV